MAKVPIFRFVGKDTNERRIRIGTRIVPDDPAKRAVGSFAGANLREQKANRRQFISARRSLKARTEAKTAKLRDQAAKADKVVPGLSGRVGFEFKGVPKPGKEGTGGSILKPVVLLDKKPVGIVRGPLRAEDLGTRAILGEVRRRSGDLSKRETLALTHQLSRKAGLKGIGVEADDFLEKLSASETFGIPTIALLFATWMVAGGLSAGSASGGGGATAGESITLAPTRIPLRAGQVSTAPGATVISPQIASLTPAANAAASTVVPLTAQASQVPSNVAGVLGTGGSGLSATSIRRIINTGIRIADTVLGGRGGGGSILGGATPSGATPSGATPSGANPQLIFQAPRQRQVIFRQPITPGAAPAFARRSRDRFGGTRTASLFTTRGERFQARTRTSVLGRA